MSLKQRMKRVRRRLASRVKVLNHRKAKVEQLRLAKNAAVENTAHARARVKNTRQKLHHLEGTLKMQEAKSQGLQALALANARQQLRAHVMETGGNNRGPAVERIITYAKGQIGEPWCVDFVIWCYGHAGSLTIRPGFTRAVAYMRTYTITGTLNPIPGDPLRYTFDHTGIFVGWCNAYGSLTSSPSDYVLTIEGNTGSTGAVSDGSGADGVYMKIRPRSLVRDFLRVTR